MKNKPDSFSIEYKVDDYTFYQSESDSNRFYVPSSEDFLIFVDKLWELTPDKTEVAENNFQLIKKYPWLFIKNRWDGGLALKDSAGNFENWFAYHEGRLLEEINKDLFIQLQDELLAEFENVSPTFKYRYTVIDIKEKFNCLRWYDGGNTEKGYEIIDRYLELFEVELNNLRP